MKKITTLLALCIALQNGAIQGGVWEWLNKKPSDKTKASVIAFGTSALAAGSMFIWKYKDYIFNTNKTQNITTLQNSARAKQLITKYQDSQEYQTKKLFEAIKNSSIESDDIKWIKQALFALQNGAQINAVDDLQETPLIKAIGKCDHLMTDLLLRYGANPNQKEALPAWQKIVDQTIQNCEDFLEKKNNEAKAIIIIKNNNLDTIKKLIKKNHPNPTIVQAAQKNDTKWVLACLQNNEDVNTQNVKGQTALYYAIKNNNRKLTELLLKNNASIHSTDYRYAMAWDWAMIQQLNNAQYNTKILDLIEEKFSPTEHMYKAIFKNDLKGFKKAITDGVNLKKESYIKEIPLSFILYTSPHLTTEKTDPIHVAAKFAGKEIITELLSRTPNSIEKKDSNGNTPLLIAAYYHNLETTKALIKMGANKNAKNNEGLSALELCLSAGWNYELSNDESSENESNNLKQIFSLKTESEKMLTLLLEHSVPLNKMPEKYYYDTRKGRALLQTYGYAELLKDDNLEQQLEPSYKQSCIDNACIMGLRKLLFDGNTSLTDEDIEQIKKLPNKGYSKFLRLFIAKSNETQDSLLEYNNTELMKQWLDVIGNRNVTKEMLKKKSPSKHLYSPKEVYMNICYKRCFKKEPKSACLSFFRENIKRTLNTNNSSEKNTIEPDCDIITVK